MQQITGKITADATIKTLDSGKQVVSFSIVDNDSYKPKDSDQWVQVPTFFNCSYWFNTNVAKVFRKGAVVQLVGRLKARGYTTNTGDAGASLDFHVNYYDFKSYAPKETADVQPNAAPKTGETNKKKTAKASDKQEENDDLPF